MKPLLYALPDHEAFTHALAAAWPGDVGELEVHRFPDGESRVRLATLPRGRDVVLVCTLHDPDARLLPLLFAAGTARELGAHSVGLVAPYLAYLRQDRRFHEGEAVSAPHFARLLSAHVDWLATVDPHLHRVHALGEIFTVPTVVAPGLDAPVCAAVHAVFAPWAYWSLLAAGVGRIVTTDTIAHASNAIPMAPAIAAACHGVVPLVCPAAA